ncbi:MAG: hypothetical protein Q8S73_37835 [Deltaproteobacteria bacterium]|nr:hypothetical protein [Myxococcales bacterium]MDP3219923.1 hypothetical protein [Deltaproteobacteria bacterium]
MSEAAETLAAEDLGPALLRREPHFHELLRIRARWLSARYYGGAVFLVGSAVTSDDPRDVDLVVVIPEALFLASYGDEGETFETFRCGPHHPTPPAIWRRWARDVARQGAELTSELRRAIDFKVQSDRDAATILDRPRHLLCHVAGGRW